MSARLNYTLHLCGGQLFLKVMLIVGHFLLFEALITTSEQICMGALGDIYIYLALIPCLCRDILGASQQVIGK